MLHCYIISSEATATVTEMCECKFKHVPLNVLVSTHGCRRWIHERCGGVRGGLRGAGRSFIFRCYGLDGPITDGLGADLHPDVGNGVSLERVDEFCCLGDVLDVDGGCDSAVVAGGRSAWREFHECPFWLERDSR